MGVGGTVRHLSCELSESDVDVLKRVLDRGAKLKLSVMQVKSPEKTVVHFLPIYVDEEAGIHEEATSGFYITVTGG